MTFFVDNRGVVTANNRVFFLHAAVEELQKTGYLSYLTLNALTRDEYIFVCDRARQPKEMN